MSDENRIEIEDGYYNAKPTCCGLTVSKNGHNQFAIECAIEVETYGGGVQVVHLTKFSGLTTDPIPQADNKSSLEMTMQDAETCGCDVDADIREWTVDPERRVRVKIVNDGEYGPKLKGIYPEGAGAGGLIRKQAMDDARKATVANQLNSQLHALRARQAARSGGAAPKTQPKPKQTEPDTSQVNDDDIPF